MNKSELVREFLQQWQEDNFEKVETATDIKVFNTVGTVIMMLNNGIITASKLDLFVTEVLELDEKEKKIVYHTVIEGMLYANKKGEEKDEKESI